jgi:hypothetical protein
MGLPSSGHDYAPPMRFGLFVPQGGRLDLVGIEPAHQRATMGEVVPALG